MRIVALFFLLHIALLAGQEQEYVFVTSEKLNSQEIQLYPAKARVPGVLWGYNYKYTPGMIMLKVSCGASDSMKVRLADGSKDEVYVEAHRAEVYQYNGSKWEYKSWYRFPNIPYDRECRSLTDMGAIASASRPLRVRLMIEDRGLTNRNVVTSWESN